MREVSRRFNSKVLLFGEYSLIYGSMALSTPFNLFTGQLVIDNDDSPDDKAASRKYILEYLNFLVSSDFSEILDLTKIQHDVDNGLQFRCDIPISYGLGSSGVVVASFYDAYARQKVRNIAELKKIFSGMESYYHGNSSGLDPLVSYLNEFVVLHENGALIHMKPVRKIRQNSGFFLIDSCTVGETQPLVNWFVEEYKKPEYQEIINNRIIPVNKKCIRNYLTGNYYDLFDNMAVLSQLTYIHFKPMIPETVKGKWEQGFNTGLYYLKLCGSGGGGMILGYSYDLERADKALGGIIPILNG